MKYLLAIAFFCFTFSLSSVVAQTPTPTPKAEDDIVIINTSLVQIDAVVTDKDGKQVSNLNEQDFEIFQNGQKQKITNFSYVTTIPAKDSAAQSTAASKVNQILPTTPVKLKPEQVRRTIALVVDDLSLSLSTIVNVRKTLKKFVDEQMLPGDLVAILRTGIGSGVLQRFTSDKTQLYAAIEKVRVNLQRRNGVEEAITLGTGDLAEGPSNPTRLNAGNAQNNETVAQNDQTRNALFANQTLNALLYIVNGLKQLPGRKAVVLFSEGFELKPETENVGTDVNRFITSPLNNLIENANRAGIVIHSIDARGVAYTGITAADSFTTGPTGNIPLRTAARTMMQTMSQRSHLVLDTQGGLAYLSDKTGGRFFKNGNDLTMAVSKVLEDEKGYYLIGYQPDEETFDPAKRGFNQLTIKIKRPGLNVKYRNGFFGISDEENKNRAAIAEKTPQAKLFEALSSPFGNDGVSVKLNALFNNDRTNGSFIQSVLHIEAKDLKFTDEPGGDKKAVVDVAAYAFNDNGVPIDRVNKNFTLLIKNDSPTYRQILEKGFVYYLNLPIKNPGGYQLRVALRDAQSEQIGAANQFIKISDLTKELLTLSGLILENMSFAGYQKLAQQQATPNNAAAAANSQAEPTDAQRDTALRRFQRDTVLQYTGTIFNAKLDSAKQPQVNTQIRLLRDGKIIFENQPSPVDVKAQPDLQRLVFGGAVFLPKDLESGDYILQIIATDMLAKEKRQTATQWIDFEIVD